jgi:hypothetical protein
VDAGPKPRAIDGRRSAEEALSVNHGNQQFQLRYPSIFEDLAYGGITVRRSCCISPMSVTPMMPIPVLSAHTELRCAVRFPLHLTVQLVSEDRQYAAVTENISANGILFHLDEPIPEDSQAEFALRMPASALGAASDVMMYGVGRIIRRSSASGKFHAAVVIDEYRFQQLTGPGRHSPWLM